MAIDTTNEKLALITFHQMWNAPAPISANGLGQDDKQHLIAEYPGILWGVIVGIGPVINPTFDSLSLLRSFGITSVVRRHSSATVKQTADVATSRTIESKSKLRTIDPA